MRRLRRSSAAPTVTATTNETASFTATPTSGAWLFGRGLFVDPEGATFTPGASLDVADGKHTAWPDGDPTAGELRLIREELDPDGMYTK